MYPFLSELLEGGFLTDGWEGVGEIRGRPPRRYYRVTDAGKEFLAEFLNASTTPQSRAPRSRLTPKAMGS
jgi:PadR family transcriptional regulator PadR